MLNSRDTHPVAEALVHAHLLRMGPAGRLAMALRLSDEMRQVGLAGATLRARQRGHGDPASDVLRMYLGEANFLKVQTHLANRNA